MAKYRKKPIVIDAFQFTNAGPESPSSPNWFGDAITNGRVYYQGGKDPYFTISTKEGKMRASLGDWIIRGIAGELYPCKPDIFAATYDPVDADQ